MVGIANKGSNRSRTPIILVSFASNNFSESLSRTVRDMDYSLETISGCDWISNQQATAVNMIVLVEHLGDISEGLSHSSSPQLLVMAASGSCDWNAGVVSHFQDFLSWPCPSFEIKYRMDRLFRADTGQCAAIGEPSQINAIKALGMIGQSGLFLKAMQEIFNFACCDAPLLISGETGTGKELAARAAHESSKRATQAFVSLNCGAIPDNLIENELFGHEKGAFTDAKDRQQGLVAQAHGGSLFLDEVDTLSPMAQIALLRFLETQEYRPLGGRGSKLSDARIIAATNTNLEEQVDQGKFRRDLYFRLFVCSVNLPPLRERVDDIDMLAQHFLERFASKYQQPRKSIHPGMSEWMREFSWKGNIRELENMLHRLFLLSKTPQIFAPRPAHGRSATGGDLSRSNPWSTISYKDAKSEAVNVFEKSYLTWLIAEAQGNLSLAARKTGQQRSTLRRLLRKHGIDKSAWKI